MSWFSTSHATSVAAPGRQAPRKPRTWLYFAVSFMAFATAPCGNATGPTLPLRFDDVPGQNAWTVGVVVDPEQIGSVRVERNIYVDGAQLRVEPIVTRPESLRVNGHTESRMQLPLEFRGMEGLTRRPAFAQKIVLEGRWLQQASPQPLRIQRWFYFKVADGTITPVTLQEYARLTDQVQATIDSRGNATTVQGGAGIKADVPLSATTGSPDSQAVPDAAAAQRNRAAPRDLSEANEK
jgi:hypothetical protein